MAVAMTCAVAEKQTEAYWISVLTFTVLLSCVGTGLCCGAITVARESRRAPLLAPAEAAQAPLADGLLSAAPAMVSQQRRTRLAIASPAECAAGQPVPGGTQTQ